MTLLIRGLIQLADMILSTFKKSVSLKKKKMCLDKLQLAVYEVTHFPYHMLPSCKVCFISPDFDRKTMRLRKFKELN